MNPRFNKSNPDIDRLVIMLVLFGLGCFLPLLHFRPSQQFNLAVAWSVLSCGLILLRPLRLDRRMLRFTQPQSHTGKASLAFLITLVLATIFSDSLIISLQRDLLYLACFLFGYTLYRLLMSGKISGPEIITALNLGLLVITVLLISIIWGMADPASHYWLIETPFYSHLRHLDYHALIVALLAMSQLYRRPFGWQNWLALAAYFAATGLIYWSGGRGVILALLVGWLIHLLAMGGERKRTLLLISIGLIIPNLIIFAFNQQYMLLEMFSRTYTPLQSEVNAMNQVTSGRLDIWKDALNIIFTSYRFYIPTEVLFGFGPGTYFLQGIKFYIVQPHNMAIMIWYNLGLAGVVSSAYLILAWLGRSIELIRQSIPPGKRQHTIGGLAAVLSVLALSATDGPLYHGFAMLLFTCAVVISLTPGNQDPFP